MNTYSQACEWAGAIFGILGAFLLATNTRISRFGWVAFLVANFAMIGFAWSIAATALLLQQVVFTATSLLGIYRSGLLRFQVQKESA